MGVRVLTDRDGESVLYCSTSMWAFGPVFGADDDPNDFLEWLEDDPRRLKDSELESKFYEWLNEVNGE